jgi:hypothetical protein
MKPGCLARFRERRFAMRLHRKHGALAWSLNGRGWRPSVHPTPEKVQRSEETAKRKLHLAGHRWMSCDGFIYVCKTLIKNVLSDIVPVHALSASTLMRRADDQSVAQYRVQGRKDGGLRIPQTACGIRKHGGPSGALYFNPDWVSFTAQYGFAAPPETLHCWLFTDPAARVVK